MATALTSAANTVAGTNSGPKPLVTAAKDVGIELAVVAALVIIAGFSSGAANAVLVLAVGLWILAGISFFGG